MNKKIVLLGPTGVGKSNIASMLASLLDAEIISADSMQIYKYMDIGTAKPDSINLKRVPHHLISIIDPGISYNVVSYIEDANKKISEIEGRGKKVIITGGTGMYIRGLLQGILKDNRDTTEIRALLEQVFEQNGIDPILEELKKVDLEKYNTLPRNDTRRIIRALEFYRINHRPISDSQVEWKNDYPTDFILLGLTMERSELYKIINKRVDRMVEMGLLDEVKNLIDMDLPETSSCWQAIGYKQMKRHLLNELSLSESLDLIKRDTRRYAKRQLTWFKKVDSIKWFNLSEMSDPLKEIIHYLEGVFN